MEEGQALYEAYQKAMAERGCEVMDWDDLEEIDQESLPASRRGIYRAERI